jgi:hypothetical protein
VVVQVKAIACELPATLGVPLSRWSISELGRHIRQSGLEAQVSDITIWRWLHADAIRPWRHRCWIFPRDPWFVEKAGRILDLYARNWEGAPLRDDEFVLSSDEKTSIQARARCHPTAATAPGARMKVEHEYRRCGAWAYMAAMDVHRARFFGRLEPKSGIEPFDRLMDSIMRESPYREARRVFCIVDNGTSHRGARSVERLRTRYPQLHLIHGPIHASWLNQIEIFFSILQRKVLTPNDFPNLATLRRRILDFQDHYERMAKPFAWTFTRADLLKLIARHEQQVLSPAA